MTAQLRHVHSGCLALLAVGSKWFVAWMLAYLFVSGGSVWRENKIKKSGYFGAWAIVQRLL